MIILRSYLNPVTRNKDNPTFHQQVDSTEDDNKTINCIHISKLLDLRQTNHKLDVIMTEVKRPKKFGKLTATSQPPLLT